MDRGTMSFGTPFLVLPPFSSGPYGLSNVYFEIFNRVNSVKDGIEGLPKENRRSFEGNAKDAKEYRTRYSKNTKKH
jgi:hypothetical protein